MGEVVNVVVAFAVIVFLVRWATRGGGGNNETQRARELLGFQPRNVTPDMISTVQSMFPHIPRDNIQFDLLRTGNIQVTSNKLLERGFLEAPPQEYFQLYPAQPANVATSSSTGQGPPTPSFSTPSFSTSTKSNLISRLGLQDRLRAEAEGTATATPIDAGGKATWEETPEMREASLRERKAQLVLGARKRFLQQQEAASVPP